MDTVRHQAQVARRRLLSERFLKYLPSNVLVWTGVALIGLALPIFIALPVDKGVWYAAWLSGGLVLALLASLLMTWLGRPTLAAAAIEIDRRFGLRERLSSAMMLGPEDRQTELGQALVADAQKRASQIDVRDKFHWGLHRGLLLPVLPALLALGLWFAPLGQRADQVSRSGVNLNQVANSTRPLIEQLKKQREELEKHGLNEAADMLRQLEDKLNDLRKAPHIDTKQSLAKLNEIRQQLEKRKEELGSWQALKKSLQNLQKLEPGPADEIAQAMQQGDFDKAATEANKLLDKLDSGEGLGQEDMQKLQQQLSQLEKSLSQAASAHEEAKKSLEHQMKQAEAAGDLQKAAQLERKLSEMMSKDSQMQQMQQMADSLAQMQQALSEGDQPAAQDQLKKMIDQLQTMSQQDGELQNLDELMDHVSQSKSQMSCDKCNGKGCPQCMKNGQGQPGKMPGSGLSEVPGSGLGEGRGQGERPEEETETDFFESRIGERMRKGETVFGGQLGGENRKGATTAEVQQAVLSSLAEEPEAFDNQPLPKSQREHTREYFNALRDGKK